MQFLRPGPVGGEIPAVRTSDGAVYSLKTITTDITGGFFETDGVARTRKALGEGSLARLSDSGDGSSLRVGAPIARPTAVIRIGQNYATHARESGGEPPPVPSCSSNTPTPLPGHTTRYPSRRAAPRPIGRLNWPSSSHGARGTWRRPQQLLATPRVRNLQQRLRADLSA